MVLSIIPLDMSKYVLPLSLAEHGGAFEIDTGNNVWRFGHLDGEVWRSADGVVCHISETRAIRCPEPLVRHWIESITEAIGGRRSRGQSPTEGARQYATSDESMAAALEMVPAVYDEEEQFITNYAEITRVRRELILDAMAIADPKRPQSKIIVGYHLLTKSGEIVDEYGVALPAWARAYMREKVGARGVGTVFADGSVKYGYPLVTRMMDELFGHVGWPAVDEKPRGEKARASTSKQAALQKSGEHQGRSSKGSSISKP